MKKSIHLLLTTLVLTALVPGAGCKKDTGGDDADQDPAGKYSFSNSEYTGIARVGNHYFPRPLSLRFGAGDDVIAWSQLTPSYQGDIPGKITKVEEGAQGQTEVTVLFDNPSQNASDQAFVFPPLVFTISADKSEITGGSTPAISMIEMKLYPKESFSVVGTWAQPDHPEWWRDVNVIKFYPEGQTTYIQNGTIIYAYDKNIIWKENFKQDGPRIIFSGLNPTQIPYLIIPYYGVLSADGNTLYVDAYATGARISYTSLSTYNGPVMTPRLLRQ